MAKVEELEVTCKSLTEENKTLSENYNSERVGLVLVVKYSYNIFT